jgi:DNA helicase-2/ATP-dependent DNA helicase PcrA
LPKEHIDAQSEPGMFNAMREASERSFGGGDFGGRREFQRGGSHGYVQHQDNLGDFHHPPRPMITIEGRAKVVERVNKNHFRRGERVFHQKFGYGSVTLAEGDKLEIEFEHSGAKKVMAAFVVPADQADQAAES